jgi:hypothetical protein
MEFTPREPDADGRVLRDRGHFIRIESVVDPPAVEPGQAARVRLLLRPHPESEAHWNNEMEEVRIWLQPGEGWEVDRQEMVLPNPEQPWSAETREGVFEARPTSRALNASAGLPGYALYYVGERPEAACLYRRQDFTVHIDVRAPQGEPARTSEPQA